MHRQKAVRHELSKLNDNSNYDYKDKDKDNKSFSKFDSSRDGQHLPNIQEAHVRELVVGCAVQPLRRRNAIDFLHALGEIIDHNRYVILVPSESQATDR